MVTSRDQNSLYVFTAASGAVPQYRVSTDPTLVTWSAATVAGDSSMHATSANQCGNAGQECSRAHVFQFMETAVAGRWLYITKSNSGYGQSGRGTQYGTLGGSWSAQIDLGGSGGLSGSGGQSTATAFLDRDGNIYYLRADEYGTNLYFQKSIDNGASWGGRVSAYATGQPSFTTGAPVGLYVKGYSKGEYIWWAGFGGTEDTVRVDPLWKASAAYPDTGTARLFGSAGGDFDAGLGYPYAFGDRDAGTGSGVYTTSATDLALPGRILPFAFTRTYNSADLTPGPLGRGWTHSYNWTLSENGNRVDIRRGDGRLDTFTAIGGGAYGNPPNVFDTLVKNGDGTFTLALTNQVQYEFNSSGILSRIHEPAGNQITLGYTSPNLVMTPIGGTVSYSASGTFSGGYLPAFAANGNKSNSTNVNVSWAKAGWSTGDWWQVTWSAPQALMRIRLWDRSASTDSFGTSGHLGFSDGSTVSWSALPGDAGPTGANYLDVSFPRKTGITWLRVVSDAGGTGNTGLAEVEAYDDASAPSTEPLPKIITDTVGRQVTLSYDANHHLASLSDLSGRKVSYGYDAQGRLSGVWDKAANATLNYRAAVQVDSPAGYWKFDESSGISVTDEVAVQAGTSFGGATRGLSGIAGTAATQFDGSSGYVSIPSNAAFNFGTGDWSIEAWLYRTGTGRDNFPVVMSKRPWQVASEPGWAITVPTTDPTKVALHVDNRDVNDVGMQTPTGLITANTWHHLALVYTAADLVGRLYLDGALVLTTPATDGTMGASNSVALTIGRNNAGTGDYLDGRVDEVAVYNHALSATRVAAHYAANPAASRRYAYDGQSQHLATITDPDARVVVTNAYDTLGRLASRKDGRQKQTTFAYGVSTTTITDPRGHATTATFDPRQRVIAVSDVVGANTYTLQYAYDPQGNRTVAVDRVGNRTDFAYNTTGDLLTRTDPQLDPSTPRAVTTWTYDGKHNVATVTDPLGFVTTNTYDATTNTLLATSSQIDATASATTKYEYADSANPGLVTKVISPRGNTTGTPDYTYSQALSYDGAGNLAQRIDADGAKTTYGYDALGRRTSTVDPDGHAPGAVATEHTWTTVYDANDRVTSQTDPLGNNTTATYDGAGNRTSATDPNGNVTAYSYDQTSRLATVVQQPDPTGQPTLSYTTTITRDDNGNPTAVTQANGVVSDYGFDALNRQTSVTTHPTTSTALTTSDVLNGNGQPTTKTLGDGTVITYAYDTNARLTAVSATGLSTISYGYDPLGRRTQMVDGTGTTTYGYDGLGRLTGATQPNGATSYGYDRDSNRTTVGYPVVGAVTYTYSPGGRLSGLTDWASHTAGYTYTAAGQAASVSAPGGLTTTYTYDTAHRLAAVRNAVGATTITDHAYTLDYAGNRTALNEIVSGITTGPGDVFDYTYDGLARLTAGATTNPESFSLDAGSNVTARTGPAATFGYDTANRLTSDGTQTVSWSDADRLTGRGADTFSYDPLGRLTSATVASIGRTYTSNGDGLLQSRTDATSGTTFLWDPASAPSRLLQVNADRIVYGLGPLYVVQADGATRSFARDGLGSVRAELDGAGAVTASFRYRAYGAISQSTGAATPSSLGYAGQLLGPSGLYYLRARWYDPASGRFVTRDPLEATGANGFGYANGNPATLRDPSGLSPALDSGGCGDLCPGDSTTPEELGFEWLTGTGPREHDFTDNDPFAELLRRSDHIQQLVADVRSGARSPSGSANYELSGLEGAPKYARDYSTVVTDGRTGNLAVTYLGSYALNYEVTNAVLTMTITNHSTIASATHPPVIGYTDWWQSAIGDRLNGAFATGPMSPTMQTIVLHDVMHR